MAPLRLAALSLLALAACGDDWLVRPPPAPLAHPVRVSGGSPFAPGCSPAAQPGDRFTGAEVEPSLAVNPADARHLVAAWQQDRWTTGGADGIVAAVSRDGGLTWARAPAPLGTCAGGSAPWGDFDRVTDPWLAFSADGATVHLAALAFDVANGFARKAVVVARSADGGATWTAPIALASAGSSDFALDKPTITADPADPAWAYAAWDRLTGVNATDPRATTGPTWFSRSSDGGATWSAPAILHDPGTNAQTIAGQIVVLPGGALVCVFVRITSLAGPSPAFDVVAARSTDRGATWGAPVLVGRLLARGAQDPKTGHPIRAGEVVPSAAVDPASGAVHVAWEDARFSGGAYDGVVHAVSTDGGLTWSAARQVNGAPEVEAFRPAIAAGGGALAVTYYDLRDDDPWDPAHSWATFWLATSADGGATWVDAPAGGPFDLRPAPDAGGWFLGDYTGLVARGSGFAALFAMSGDSTDVFVSR